MEEITTRSTEQLLSQILSKLNNLEYQVQNVKEELKTEIAKLHEKVDTLAKQKD